MVWFGIGLGIGLDGIMDEIGLLVVMNGFMATNVNSIAFGSCGIKID